MDKPFFRLVGAPCGQHGQYTFYKALRVTGRRERVIAIGDFFFVRIWQDSELVSIGELQLLWTDRVSDQTLVSLRLYFLPENTPEGRGQHGEDEVLAISDKVVVRAEDLMSWMCEGDGWRWGLRAVWRGACAPAPDAPATQPLHHTRLDFSDVDKEKSAIAVDPDSPGVVVFSYPRYCRYRALAARLHGLQAAWLRDALVAALGGYAAPTRNTRILYCKDTFEYPELEGHEFVCSHLAPRLKGRPRGRRRRAARSRSRSRSSRSSDSDLDRDGGLTPRRLSLRNGDKLSDDEEEEREDSAEDREFLAHLRRFYKDRNEPLKGHTLKDLSLRALYLGVASRGGYAAVCRARLWRVLHHHAPHQARRRYERFLLPFENHERKNGTTFKINGKLEEPQTIDTIDVTDSPLREADLAPPLPEKRLRTPSPKREVERDCKEDLHVVSKPAEELNREFLASLKEEAKVCVKQDLDRQEKPLLNELAHKLMVSVSAESRVPETTSMPGVAQHAALHMPHAAPQPACVNGHAPQAARTLNNEQKGVRPAGRSSLRAVRVKPARPQLAAAPATPPSLPGLRGDSSSSPPSSAPPAHAPPVSVPTTINNFGIHHPPLHRGHHSDDEIVEVPYKPKTPEIIDLDEYPESPQAVKKKKLDILKERGLEVTALPAPGVWAAPGAPVLLQHQLLTQAQLLSYGLPYRAAPPAPPAPHPPRVLQSTCTFGSSGPQKTVYGDPKDPYMPAPHVLRGAPLRPARAPPPEPRVLDLTCRAAPPAPSPAPTPAPAPAPAVEIVRVSAQNLSRGPAADGQPNLEITLVHKAPAPAPAGAKARPPQKRSSNGKFVSAKTPTPPKEPGSPAPSPSPSPSPKPRRPAIVVPTYQLDVQKAAPLTSVASVASVASLMDPYVALYSSLAGQMDHRQLAVYRDLMATQFRSYSGLLNMATPTTKN